MPQNQYGILNIKDCQVSYPKRVLQTEHLCRFLIHYGEKIKVFCFYAQKFLCQKSQLLAYQVQLKTKLKHTSTPCDHCYFLSLSLFQ
jgi:penicillin-binding protein-related factor A (putative recombinase)